MCECVFECSVILKGVTHVVSRSVNYAGTYDGTRNNISTVQSHFAHYATSNVQSVTVKQKYCFW